jgi:hypothetical protein
MVEEDTGNQEVAMGGLQEEVMDSQEGVSLHEGEVGRHRGTDRLKMDPITTEINPPLEDIEDLHQREFQVMVITHMPRQFPCHLEAIHLSDQKTIAQALPALSHLRRYLALTQVP